MVIDKGRHLLRCSRKHTVGSVQSDGEKAGTSGNPSVLRAGTGGIGSWPDNLQGQH